MKRKMHYVGVFQLQWITYTCIFYRTLITLSCTAFIISMLKDLIYRIIFNVFFRGFNWFRWISRTINLSHSFFSYKQPNTTITVLSHADRAISFCTSHWYFILILDGTLIGNLHIQNPHIRKVFKRIGLLKSLCHTTWWENSLTLI